MQTRGFFFEQVVVDYDPSWIGGRRAVVTDEPEGGILPRSVSAIPRGEVGRSMPRPDACLASPVQKQTYGADLDYR
jgi:hypothetical protein